MLVRIIYVSTVYMLCICELITGGLGRPASLTSSPLLLPPLLCRLHPRIGEQGVSVDLTTWSLPSSFRIEPAPAEDQKTSNNSTANPL